MSEYIKKIAERMFELPITETCIWCGGTRYRNESSAKWDQEDFVDEIKEALRVFCLTPDDIKAMLKEEEKMSWVTLLQNSLGWHDHGMYGAQNRFPHCMSKRRVVDALIECISRKGGGSKE